MAEKKSNSGKKTNNSRTTNKKTNGSKATSANRKNKRTKQTEKLLKIFGMFVCVLQLVAGIMATLYLVKLNMFPTKYIAIFAGVYLFVTIIFFVLQKWPIPGIITKFLSLIIMAITILGCVYADYTYDKIKDMLNIETKVDNVNVYVLKDDPAQDVVDAKDYTFGILVVQDRDNTDKVLEDINKEVGKEVAVTEYDSVMGLMQALYDQEVGCIVLNSAYISFVSEDENYKDFPDKVRSIATKNIETVVEVKEEIPEDYLYSGDKVFTIFVSGVDTRSSVNENSNSDVNILVTVNMETRQILMINTPRDFYVPLSISDGIPDKLTHAGIYGVDVSKDTLGMLYEVYVDDYVRINFTGFKEIIDELGGITVYSEYSFWSDDYHYEVGYNEMDGAKALAYARNRKAFNDGDRQRGRNQMAVIEAVINKMLSSDMLYNYTDVLDAISDSMITSMSYDEISELVKFQLNDMRGWDIIKYDVNGYDSMSTTYSVPNMATYVMKPNQDTIDQAKEYLRQMYNNEKVVLVEE